MMKSTLIKHLYGEIDRLKAELYASREKNGVYMPKERYYQEESERKAMADQIEQMGVTIENHQNQFEELRAQVNAGVLKCSDLSVELDATQKKLDQTSKLLANAEDEVKRCQYAIRERDFIISEQKKAGREDKLNADNRSVVDKYQAELTKEINVCNTVATSITQQNEHLQCIEKFCNSFSDVNVKLQHRKHYQSWTLDEVVALVDGVEKYGVGRWSQIKREFFASNSHRTSGNLKDKWRSLLKSSGVDCSWKNASIPIPPPILAQVRAIAKRDGGVEIVPE